MSQDLFDKKVRAIIKIVLVIGFCLLIILNAAETVKILRNIFGILSPLLLGAAIAYVLNILVSRFEKIYFPRSRKKAVIRSRRTVCILLSILAIVIVLVFFLQIIIPKLNQLISLLRSVIPDLYKQVVEWSIEYADEFPALRQELEELNVNGQKYSAKGMEILGNWALGTISMVGTIFNTIMNFILAFIFSLYILFEKEELQRKFDKLFRTYMKPCNREKLYYITRTADECFTNFVVGQFKEAIILGVLCTIGMLIFRFPYAALIGPVIGLTALIPMLGAYIGAAIGFLLIVIVNPLQAVLFLVFIVVLQQVEGNLIYPKVVGESIGLPGIWVFAAIIVGGGLMGVPGILLGVPFFATVYKLLSEAVQGRTK